jgi:hypothetical protein
LLWEIQENKIIKYYHHQKLWKWKPLALLTSLITTAYAVQHIVQTDVQFDNHQQQQYE